MKTSTLTQILWVALIVSTPFIYLAWVWNDLPQTIPTHFGIDGKPDAFGTKMGLLAPICVVMGVGLLVYFLITNIEKFDPKRAKQVSKETFNKFAVLTLMFMSGISLYVIYSTIHGQIGGFLFVLLGLFFAAMGNLMHSVEPNYFVGIRLPWTLNSDDNWRKTHQLAGKVWFAGGLLVAFLSLLVSGGVAFLILVCIIVVMVIIPVVYSYQEYKKTAS